MTPACISVIGAVVPWVQTFKGAENPEFPTKSILLATRAFFNKFLLGGGANDEKGSNIR